jgi:hypothetical protein
MRKEHGDPPPQKAQGISINIYFDFSTLKLCIFRRFCFEAEIKPGTVSLLSAFCFMRTAIRSSPPLTTAAQPLCGLTSGPGPIRYANPTIANQSHHSPHTSSGALELKLEYDPGDLRPDPESRGLRRRSRIYLASRVNTRALGRRSERGPQCGNSKNCGKRGLNLEKLLRRST